jgi:transcription elongation factor GreB
MSRAFVKEDVDPPERSGRKRSASGLPPGATNYITARGAQRLKDELEDLRKTGGDTDRMNEVEQTLASVTIVSPPDSPSESVGFGATVTIEDVEGKRRSYTIVGVDELGFEPDAVSWITPMGKALLAAELGGRVTVGEQMIGKVVKVEYRVFGAGR